MLKSFFLNKKWLKWAWGGAFILFISLLAQVTLTVKINTWYKGFYDVLQEAKDIDQFWIGISNFLYLAIPYVFIYTLTNYLTRIWVLKWREAMTFDYVPLWSSNNIEVEGAAQRMQEDTMRFAYLLETLGLQVVRAIMTLLAFLPILWNMSKDIKVDFLNNIEGSLVWIAIITSFGSLIISWYVGIKLPGIEYDNQKVEAKFRKELVYGEDDRLNYAKPDTIFELFTGIKLIKHKLYLHYGYFDIWENLYSQMMVIVPYIVVAPSLFSGLVTLGVVIQTSNAFQRVHNSFSLFTQNWTTVTELRSVYKRLKEFELAIGYN